MKEKHSIKGSPVAILAGLLTGLFLLSGTSIGQTGLAERSVEKGRLTSPGLKAAVIKVDITPTEPKMLLGYQARQSTSVHDQLFQKVLALSDGTNEWFLVSTDICLVSPAEVDKVTGRLQKEMGIRPQSLWWTVTHTHSAPEVGTPGLLGAFLGERYHHAVDTAYTRFVEDKLVDAVKAARSELTPARLGVGWGFSMANINRRAIDVDGKASLGLNPAGPVDRRIGVLRIEKADGRLLALVANYPIHGTVLGGESLAISGDAPGIVSKYVEEQLGAPVLFINGAAGNLAPIYSVYSNPAAGHLSQFRVLLGDPIIEANNSIAATTDAVQLSVGSLTVQTPGNDHLKEWPGELAGYVQPGKQGTRNILLPVRFLKINDNIAVWSAPVELFCEISNSIREQSPFPFTFYFGYSGGWLGYLPTEEQWKYGGYEVETVSPYTPAAGADLTQAVVGYLQGEMKSPAQGQQLHAPARKAKN